MPAHRQSRRLRRGKRRHEGLSRTTNNTKMSRLFPKDPQKLFWSHVEIRGLDDCWPWTGCVNSSGYGSTRHHGSNYCAHRVAYSYTREKIPFAAPEDKSSAGFVLHSCDNPPCCNPTHLSLGTLSKNQLDSYARERNQALKGERSPNAKLTLEQVAVMRTLFRDKKATTYELARLYEVSQRAAWLVVANRSYKNAA